MTAVRQVWWCPTCKTVIPQPRWMNMGKPNQTSYHLVGLQTHKIERVEMLDGEVTPDRPALP